MIGSGFIGDFGNMRVRYDSDPLGDDGCYVDYGWHFNHNDTLNDTVNEFLGLGHGEREFLGLKKGYYELGFGISDDDNEVYIDVDPSEDNGYEMYFDITGKTLYVLDDNTWVKAKDDLELLKSRSMVRQGNAILFSDDIAFNKIATCALSQRHVDLENGLDLCSDIFRFFKSQFDLPSSDICINFGKLIDRSYAPIVKSLDAYLFIDPIPPPEPELDIYEVDQNVPWLRS